MEDHLTQKPKSLCSSTGFDPYTGRIIDIVVSKAPLPIHPSVPSDGTIPRLKIFPGVFDPYDNPTNRCSHQEEVQQGYDPETGRPIDPKMETLSQSTRKTFNPATKKILHNKFDRNQASQSIQRWQTDQTLIRVRRQAFPINPDTRLPYPINQEDSSNLTIQNR